MNRQARRMKVLSKVRLTKRVWGAVAGCFLASICGSGAAFGQAGPPSSPSPGIPQLNDQPKTSNQLPATSAAPSSNPAPDSGTKAGSGPITNPRQARDPEARPGESSESYGADPSQSPSTESPSTQSPSVETRIRRFLLQRPDLPCRYLAHWQRAPRIWVACGRDGLLVLAEQRDGHLRAESTRDLGGNVVGFFSRGGHVWVRVAQEHHFALAAVNPEAATQGPPNRPFPGLAPPPPGLGSGSAKPANPPEDSTAAQQSTTPDQSPVRQVSASGSVLRVDGRSVIVSLGSLHGVGLGDRIAVYDNEPTGGLVVGGEQSGVRRRAVVARVVELWRNRSRIRVGVNEAVEVAATARWTSERATARRNAPPRASDVLELRAMGRPMFSFGAVGGGIMAEVSLSQRTSSWRYGLALNPIGIGANDDGVLAPWAGMLFGSFDSTVFEAGLGVGAQSVNDTDVETGSGLSLVQLLRLGYVDGMHLSARTTAVIFRSTTEFAGLEVQGQLAIADSAWLIARGGAGSVGFGFGELALRRLVHGYGGPGSFFLEVSVGGSVLREASCPEVADFATSSVSCSEQNIAGLMLGLGGEWRFEGLH